MLEHLGKELTLFIFCRKIQITSLKIPSALAKLALDNFKYQQSLGSLMRLLSLYLFNIGTLSLVEQCVSQKQVFGSCYRTMQRILGPKIIIIKHFYSVDSISYSSVSRVYLPLIRLFLNMPSYIQKSYHKNFSLEHNFVQNGKTVTVHKYEFQNLNREFIWIDNKQK